MAFDPDRFTAHAKLHDGTRILLRPISPDDKERFLQGFERLSPESRYRRFMSPVPRLTGAMLAYLTEIDYVDHFALAALDLDAPEEPGVGVARYVRLKGEPEVAEAAVAVLDDYHGRGLGTLMLQSLASIALYNGIKRFRALVLGENKPAIEMLKHLGGRVTPDGQGVFRVEMDLPEEEERLKDTPMYGMLRAVAKGEMPPVRAPGHDREG